MAYDDALAQRFRDALGGLPGLAEKRMMGGVCFLVNGNMIGGADRTRDGQRRLMFRVGKDNEAEAAGMPGAEPMIMGERRMSGFFFVEDDNCDDSALRQWVSLAVSHAMSLPPK